METTITRGRSASNLVRTHRWERIRPSQKTRLSSTCTMGTNMPFGCSTRQDRWTRVGVYARHSGGYVSSRGPAWKRVDQASREGGVPT